MVRWFLAGVMVWAAVAYLRAPAEACSYREPFELAEDVRAGLTGIPVSGVVPIYASVWQPGTVDPPEITVRDPDGAEIGGRFELYEQRAVWRSDAPLSPATTYAVTLVVDRFGSHEFTFTTATTDDTPPLVLRDIEVNLGESHRAERQICCNSGESSCGGPFLTCWTQTVVTEVDLWGTFSYDVEAARYYVFDGEATGATDVYAHAFADGRGWFSANFTRRGEEYCTTVRARSLVGGPDVTRTLCLGAAALEEEEPFTPAQPDYGECDEPPFDPDTGEPVDTGCSAGGAGAAPLLVILAALGVRRRRR